VLSRGSAKSSTDCSERRTANRPLVEISPVMPRFNVVIPQVIIRGRAVLTYISSHYYKAPRDMISANIVLPLRDQRAHLIGNFYAPRARDATRRAGGTWVVGNLCAIEIESIDIDGPREAYYAHLRCRRHARYSPLYPREIISASDFARIIQVPNAAARIEGCYCPCNFVIPSASELIGRQGPAKLPCQNRDRISSPRK